MLVVVVVVRVAELRRDHVQRNAVFQHDSRVAVACTVQRDRRDACGHHEPPPPALRCKTRLRASAQRRHRHASDDLATVGVVLGWVEVAFAVGFLTRAIFHG